LQANLGPSLAQWTHSRAIGGGATAFETKITKKKPNVRINILDEAYPLQDESITQIDNGLKHTMRVLHKGIKELKQKMKVLLKPNVEICIK